MIVADKITDVQTQGVGETARATIKASARLFQFFSDQIYADKYVAIWRELVANGMDAQVAAGNPQQQMIVTLPTDYTPYAKVRDFGTGMSHEFLMGKFMAYTDASTKENSNDFIGGFGIGSKAPLAYTEQFAIHSYQNGEVGIYSIFKDETGCPAIAFLGRHPSPEADGIEISFPVEGADIQAFRDASYRTLNYFNPAPLLVNATEQLAVPEYTVKTETWGFLKGANTSRIVQGGIAYPIDKGQVPEIDYLLDYGIDFYVPIGSCNIALSRERLAYDDRTNRLLRTLANAIRPDLEQHIKAMFENCKTLWEAECLFAGTQQAYSQKSKMIAGFASWKGKKLRGWIPVTGNPWSGELSVAKVTTNRYGKSNYNTWTEGRNSPTMRSWMHDLHPKDIKIVLIDDKPNKPVLRMRRYLEENDISDQGVVIFRPHNTVEMSDMDWGRFLVSIGRPPFKRLSEIEPAVVNRNSGTVREQKVRAYKGSFSAGPHTKSKFVDKLPDKGGYYMYMESFDFHRALPDGTPQATLDELFASGLTQDDVYWFNKGDFQIIKNDPNWKPAKVAFEEAMKKYVASHRNMALAQAFQILKGYRYSYYNNRPRGTEFYNLICNCSGFVAPTDSPLIQFIKLHDLVRNELNDADNKMRMLLKVDSTKQYALLLKLINEAADKHPELHLLLTSRSYGEADSKLVSVYNKLA